MKTSVLITTVCIIMALSSTVSLSLEEFMNYKTSESVRHHIVKRKGGGRGGGRGMGRSRSSSSHKSHKPASNPYPKQPPYNPNYPNQQTPHNTGYGQQMPHNTGHGQQMGYPSQTGYNQNYGQTSKTGGLLPGVLGGAAGGGAGLGHKSKTGILGSGLGGAAVGGVAGAALGAYGGYKLGKMVGSLGRYGHYGYYDNGHYRRCEPPPRVEFDPITNTSYIPRDVRYDNRCEYYDHDPSRSYGYQNYRYGVNAQNKCIASNFWLIIGFIVNAFWIIGKLQLYFM